MKKISAYSEHNVNIWLEDTAKKSKTTVMTISHRVESIPHAPKVPPIPSVLTYDCKNIVFNLGGDIMIMDVAGSGYQKLASGTMPLLFK